MVDNEIETVSISYENATSPHDAEYLAMDEFAYRFPFPIFVNPAANKGHELEVHWQPYNAISVGNVRHTEQVHYELAGCTQSRNPDPEYGFCIDGGIVPDCAGDREMPYIVAPGISPLDQEVTDERFNLIGSVYCGTSISAPTLNGIAADVISADSRMKYASEKVRTALLLTAHNVHAGHWNRWADGRDGTGVVSGTDAVRFAKEHETVEPFNDAPVETGLATGAFGQSDTGTELEFAVRVPDVKPADHHLRILLTWNSLPDRDQQRNTLSDLDLLFSSKEGRFNYDSTSLDSNVEVIDVPSRELVSGAAYPVKVVVTLARVPETAVSEVFFWALGWTWVRDHADLFPAYTTVIEPAKTPGERTLLDEGGILDTLYGLENLERVQDQKDQYWLNRGGGRVTAKATYTHVDIPGSPQRGRIFGYFLNDETFRPIMTLETANAFDSNGFAAAELPNSELFPVRWGVDPNLSSLASDNAGVDHMVTWFITSGPHSGNYVLAWEDFADHDYNDLVVEVSGVEPIEPTMESRSADIDF